jgi:uncharacterized protein (TIRG00374 family)
MRDSKILWYGVSTAIIAGLIYFVDFNKFISAITSARPLPMALALISGFSVFAIWGYIWHSFFTTLEIETTLYKSYKMFMAGHFVNSITPLGQVGGEPFMAYIVSKNTGSSYERSLSSVMSSDIINAIPIVTYTAAGITYALLFRGMTGVMEQMIYFGAGVTIITSILIYLLWFDREKLRSGVFFVLNALESRFASKKDSFESIKDRIKLLEESFEEIGENPSHLIKVALISHLYLITQFVSLYFILLGLDTYLSFVGIYFTVILAGLAMFAPTPGGSGAFEAAFTGLLLFFYPSMDPSVAVAASILFRMTTYWPGILVGYISIIDLRRNRDFNIDKEVEDIENSGKI